MCTFVPSLPQCGPFKSVEQQQVLLLESVPQPRQKHILVCFQPLAACITNWQQLVLLGELQLLSPFLHLESWHQYKVSRVHMYTWQLDTIIHTAAPVKKMLFMLRTPALEAWKCSPITWSTATVSDKHLFYHHLYNSNFSMAIKLGRLTLPHSV